MARIAGVEIPDDKQIEISLTYIHGIGNSLSKEVLEAAKIKPSTRTKELSNEDLNKLRNIISEKYTIEGDLKRRVRENIKRLKDIGTYRGARHEKGLPARGQTTRVNSRTVRGNKRTTVGSGRKPPPSAT